MSEAYLKRLRILELKEAKLGQSVPAEILLEIGELREKIADINSYSTIRNRNNDLDNMMLSGHDNVNGERIEIMFKGKLDGMNPEIKKAVIRAVAAIMDIPLEQVKIHEYNGKCY